MSKRTLTNTFFLTLAILWIGAAYAGGDSHKYGSKSGEAKTSVIKAATIEDCLGHKAFKKFHTSVMSTGLNPANVNLTNGVEWIAFTDDPAKLEILHKAYATRKADSDAIKHPETELCQYCQDFQGNVKAGKINWEFAKFDRGILELYSSQDPALAKHLQEDYGPQEKKG